MEYPVTSATAETLPNGLTLILDPDPTAQVVSAQLWVESGSMHEDLHAGSGISHFLEHMVFKGVRNTDGETLASNVQAAGGHWNAYTSFDRTVYHIDGPSASLAMFLDTLTGLVFFPILPESEFEKEKDVIRREIDMGLDDPDNVASQLLFSTVFQADPRKHPVIGHRHLFDALQYSDLTAYRQNRYTTDRTFCVISGDFSPEEAREQMVRLTADVKPGGGREPLAIQDSPQMGTRRARQTFEVPTSRISLSWKAPALDHPDAPAFDLLAAILGRGRSSRLHRTLREEKELALEISAFSWTGPGREGLFGISAEADPAKRDSLIEAILAEIATIHGSSLDAELAKAKRQTAVSQFRNLTTASGRAADLASNWRDARDLDFTRHYLAAIHRVTVAGIEHAASKLTSKRLSITILDPLESPAPVRKLKQSHTTHEVGVHTLENGLRIALIPDHRVPMVHLQVAARGGLVSEAPESNGLNQLLASTLTKGTTRRSAHELAVTLESLGASISASTGNNALLVNSSGLAEDFATLAEVLAEVIISPALLPDAIQRERASQMAALEEALTDPLHTGIRELRNVVFGGNGYGLDPLGSISTLPKLDRQSLSDHHLRHFNSSNMALAISGDFKPDEVLTVLERAFALLPMGEPWSPAKSTLAGGSQQFRNLEKKQAVVTVGFPGTSIAGADRYALAMIQEYASDMAGPLFTRIREELGLAYQVGATQFLGYDTGLFTFYLATSPEEADFAGRELLSEISKIAANGIPDEVFEQVRSTVLSALMIQQQSPASIARQVALDVLFNHPADEFRRLPDYYLKLNAADVREHARRIFSVEPTVVTVQPTR